MLTLQPKGVKTKYLKFFYWKIFSIHRQCQRRQWCTLNCEYLREFLNKFETAQRDTRAKLIQEKNLKSKILWYCPVNKCIFILSLYRGGMLSVTCELCLV
jgi:hypothetical protein